MFATLVNLLVVITVIEGYKITAGNQSIIPKNIDLNGVYGQESQGKVVIVKNIMLFPFDVYNYRSKVHEKEETNNYIFIKKGF